MQPKKRRSQRISLHNQQATNMSTVLVEYQQDEEAAEVPLACSTLQQYWLLLGGFSHERHSRAIAAHSFWFWLSV
jgi:hypothetical protein